MPQNPGEEPARAAHAQIELQRRARRAGRYSGAGRQRHAALLPERRGQGRPQRLHGKAPARLLEVSQVSVGVRAPEAGAGGAAFSPGCFFNRQSFELVASAGILLALSWRLAPTADSYQRWLLGRG